MSGFKCKCGASNKRHNASVAYFNIYRYMQVTWIIYHLVSAPMLIAMLEVHEPLRYVSVIGDRSISNAIKVFIETPLFWFLLDFEVSALISSITQYPRISFSATEGMNTLSWDGEILKFKITEHAFFSVRRFLHTLKFKKIVPAKSSPNYYVFYTCESQLLGGLIPEIQKLAGVYFSSLNIEVILEAALPFLLEAAYPSYKESQLSAFSKVLTKIEDPDEFYEYLCLLHVNGFPDSADDHVAAVNSYVIPEGPSLNKPLMLMSLAGVSPLQLLALLKLDFSSILVNTRTSSYAQLRTEEDVYEWHFDGDK